MSENVGVLREHLAAENNHDLAGTLATVHPECVFVDRPLALTFHGREGAGRHYQMWWSAFGVTVENGTSYWIRDDLLVGEAHFAGRHVGEFVGIPPTGREVSLPFVVFVDFRDGLLAGERFQYDLNGLLGQLGQRHFVVPGDQ